MRRRNEQFPDNGFEAWGGYMQAKITKLEDQFCVRAGQEEILSDIFNGISIYVNGFTTPSADELKILMSKHGGVYHTYQRNDDFIIASNLPDTKVKNMNLARVVKPEWITESLAVQRLLDYREFLLYKHSRTQKQLNFEKLKSPDDANNFQYCQNLTTVKDDKSILHVNLANSSSNIETKTANANLVASDKKSISKIGTVTTTAADPNFISEFYNNSRLHHISQLGACFKQYINDLRESSSFLFPAREGLREKVLALNSIDNISVVNFEKNEIIMHIDMDCFFVSVGLRNRPDLKGKPIAVTHSKGGQVGQRSKRAGVDRNKEFDLYKRRQAEKLSKATGVAQDEIVFESRVDNIVDEDDKHGSMSEIASCSYEARAKGIVNGMFMGSALQLCPDLQTIPYDFDGYKEVAFTLYNTIAQYTLDIEAVSCDEMYVDCTELISNINVNIQGFATVLRDEIKLKTGCPCSTGFGGNRLQARLATKKAKPDGQFFLTEDLVEDFIFDIKLSDLPGVGRQTAHKLESLGHITCGSLQTLSLSTLKSHLGNKNGAHLFEHCRGRDPNPLTFHNIRKSVSAEVNYGIRFDNSNQCIEFLKQLSAEVQSRMEQLKVLGKCITLKLMVRAEDAPVETAKFMGHGFCRVINKSVSLTKATNNVETISKEVISLCQKLNIDHKEMRGIGIQVTRLESLSNKQNVGAINKYLFNKKIANVDIKNETNVVKAEPINVGFSEKFDSNIKPCTQTKSNLVTNSNIKSSIPATSLASKRPGRPSKNSTLHQPSKNLMNKYLQGQNISKNLPYKDPMMKQYPYVKAEIQPKIEEIQAPETHTSRGLLGLPWDKVRDLLRAWLESGQPPLQCDVDMIVDYLQEMVINKNIEKLYVLMNFQKRMTREIGSTTWLEAYNHISEQVQNAMLAVYGKKLFIAN